MGSLGAKRRQEAHPYKLPESVGSRINKIQKIYKQGSQQMLENITELTRR